jgi:hypothetical protein
MNNRAIQEFSAWTKTWTLTNMQQMKVIELTTNRIFTLLTFFTEPAVIPLQALGVIDAGATYVGDNEVLANAMANTTSTSVQNGYVVKRGSAFVNEYPRINSLNQCTIGGPEDPNHMMAAFPVLWPYAEGGFEIG